MGRRSPFSEWKVAAQVRANALHLPDDLWTKDDLYDLKLAAKEAFRMRVSPEAFVEKAFEEDITMMKEGSVGVEQQSLADVEMGDKPRAGFVDVPATAMRGKLHELGFQRVDMKDLLPSIREEVYERAHHKDARYKIMIYTSIGVGAVAARGCGQDAIRVVVVFFPSGRGNGSGCGVYKGTRVHRTGSVDKVLERVTERLRAAYAFVNERLKIRGEKR